MKKRVFSLLLVIALCLTIAPLAGLPERADAARAALPEGVELMIS